MVLPNFLLIGAAKAGTTSLYNYLVQHPQIYMSPIKEPRYFAPEYYTTHYKNIYRDEIVEAGKNLNELKKSGLSLQDYESLFQGVKNETAIGEASTEYIFFEKSAQRIKEQIPDVKIIAVLRNPVDRAFSAYCYHVRDGRETLSFQEALDKEEQRESEQWQVGWFYRKGGFYFEQLNRYFQVFDENQIKIILWEDLNYNTQAVCRDVFEFLRIDSSFCPDLSRTNKSLMPKNEVLNRLIFKNTKITSLVRKTVPTSLYKTLISKVESAFYTSKPELELESRRQLIDLYRDDIVKLEKLISRDLSSWMLLKE